VSLGKGFLYRFPDQDFELGFGRPVPLVGETLRAKGRVWKVTQVSRGSEGRAIVNLEPVEDQERLERGTS
jgi:hypothetical protein